jgi:hypothetical protein
VLSRRQGFPERPCRFLEGSVGNLGPFRVFGGLPHRILKVRLGDAAPENVADHLAAIGAAAAPDIEGPFLRLGNQVIAYCTALARSENQQQQGDR